MTTDESESVRRRWMEQLGVRRPPGSGGRWGDPGAGPHGTTRFDLHLHTFGADWTCVLLLPSGTRSSPVVVVPFYDTESLLGLPSRLYPLDRPGPRRDYADRFAARGIGVLAVPWWAETAVRDDGATELATRYGPPAAAHAARFPGVTGLGRSIADLMLAVDLLAEVPGVDAGRVGAFGHSLGGKLALFLAALDVRIRAAVTHEPGLGLAHSNWGDPWYFADRSPADRDLDELTGLIAPRPLLYAGGGASDGPHNRDVADRASQHWPAGGFDTLLHNGGHPLPDHVFAACATWLADRLG